MNNNLLQLKIKQRTNKLSSNDYDSFECWMIVEAFNKVQNQWVRREAKASEENKTNIDDLQKITKELQLNGSNMALFFETSTLPIDYFAGRRVSAKGITDVCKTPSPLVIYPGEESNRDILLRDENTNPNFEWRETFKTELDNKIRIYTNGKFSIVEPVLTYYRKPRQISFEGCVNEYDQSTLNVECEFKDDLVELLIEECAAQLAYDIESLNTAQINAQNATRNK